MLAMALPGHEFDSKHALGIIDSVPALIHTGRPDGHLDYFNQRWLDYLGVPMENLLGWKWTAAIHPEDVEAIVSRWRFSIASGGLFLHEARVRQADGEYRWMLHHKIGLRDEHGEIVKWYGSSIDIEDRKRAEERLRKDAQELQRSDFYLEEGQRLGHMGSWAFKPSGLFDYWSRELFQIYGLEPESGPPTLEQYLATVHPEDRDFMAETIKQMLALGSGCDVKKRIVRPNGELRYVRCVGIPVLDNGVLHGFLGTAMDVTEHELLTQELRRREGYLAEAQRLSHTGSFGWKPESGEVVWSDETYQIFEYDHTVQPTMDSVVQRVHPDDRADFQKVIDGASAGATHLEHTYRLLLPDGRVKHVHALANAARDASGNREFLGAGIDITSIKRAEEELRKSEEQWRDVFENNPTMYFMVNAAGIVLTVNPFGAEQLGYTVDELVGQKVLKVFYEPDREEAQAHAAQCLKQLGRSFSWELRVTRKSGSVLWVRETARAVFRDNGPVVLIACEDVTERKTAEEKIREQEMELRQMLDLTPQHVAVFGPGGERLYSNRIGLDYVGLNLEEWRQTPGKFFGPGSFIHPDDRERAARAFPDSSRSSGSAYELELRVRGADGNCRWFLVRYNPLHDDKGQVKRWYVALTDIDERKRAEEKLQQENVALREEIEKTSMFEEIVGTSSALKNVLSRISKVARSDSTVLITGETGTGKELVARAIHGRSNRVSRPFVSVNCATIPFDLIASELFGHEKGAFTGAIQRRLGRFELAHGGTIFLDEVGELLPDTQVALLRVLQEREFERVGGTQLIRVDVRVIAATNRDLKAAVANGTFRQDLFYRLNVFPIEVPPLRERRDDILMLVEYFVQRYANRAGKSIRSIEKKTLDLLQSYDWPGNIRELQNVIERSVILSSCDVFSVDGSWLSIESRPRRPRVEAFPPSADEEKEEQKIIEAALAESRGRVWGPAGAAAKLGIPPSTLDYKIKSLKIRKSKFKFR
jgi:PAS domain S-box-containing protein